MAYNTKCTHGNETDNKEIVKKLVNTRLQMGRLLDYGNFTEYVLEERMAQTSDNVYKLLYQLLEAYKPTALQEYADVQTLAETGHLVQQQLQKLQDNLNYLTQHLQPNPKINFTTNYPSIYLNWDKSYEILLKNKIVITHFDYPSDQKTLNRIVISANHQKEDLDQLVQVLNSFL